MDATITTGESIKIGVGETMRDYQTGNFLNAVDELVTYFHAKRCMSSDDIKYAMELYAKRIAE